ncbi:MATE family efflux transporter, partial [uncultured Prevotella sp.]|uniref:MATE family efflux transporter n=1 Tax=uncultured Prevotella sp. TaxID=159272 RepID=UPI0025D988AB
DVIIQYLIICPLLIVSAVFYLNLHRMGQPVELLPYMRSYLLVNIVSLPFLCWFNAFKQFYDGITDTRVPMFVILGGNVLNICGNYVLIYGAFGMPELGLLGAGISTLVSRIVMFVAFVCVFLFRHRYAPYRRGYASGRVNRADFSRLNSLGWPVALQLGMECAAFSLSAIFVGWIGITALAAHQVTLTASQLLYMVNSGMAAAVAVRVSYFNGQGDKAAVRDAAYAGFHLIMLIAFVLSVPVFLLRNTFSYWFTDSAEVCVLVSQTVIPLIVYQFGDGLQYTFANALRGISCVRPLIWIAFFSYFVVSLPLGWFLGIHSGWGLVGVWSAFPVCLLCAGILYWLCFINRLRRP